MHSSGYHPPQTLEAWKLKGAGRTGVGRNHVSKECVSPSTREIINTDKNEHPQDFPGGPMYKNRGDTDLIPSLGRFHMPQSN